jgi:hypothetical protein
MWNHNWNRPGYDWWSRPHPGFYNWYTHGGYNPWRWWGPCTWAGVTGWIAGAAWGTAWGTPVAYDYGSGGNVVYQDNSVYVNGQQAGTADDYAQQAYDLAQAGSTALAPYDQAEDNGNADNAPQQTAADWMPLGTFGLTDVDGGEPNVVMQLAVNKQGIISGTYRNEGTDTSVRLQGSVDKKTQRAAWWSHDYPGAVFETGIYNLTKDQTTCLVHYGKTKTETKMLVRLNPPKDGDAPPGAGSGDNKTGN